MKRYLFLTVTLVLFFAFTVNAFAATYYVKPDGNDKLEGRSDATAWKTIGKVNSYSFATGDDVYFKCGGTWTGSQLWVDWSGNAGNRAVIGAYYMSGGSESVGVSGDKPIIDGNDAVPSRTSYQGLVQLSGISYVTVENLRIINSECYALNAEKSSYINAAKIETNNLFSAGIRYKTVSNGVIKGCDITDTGRQEWEGPMDWPGSIVTLYSSNIIIRKNKVHENYGEGIGIYRQSYGCLVEDNICYANKKVQIYVNWSWNNTVRRNLCYGTSDTTFQRSSWGPGLGIVINDEKWQSWPGAKNNEIYNNVVAYCSKGIVLWGPSDWALTGMNVYNNTVIDCDKNLEVSSRRSYVDSNIKNNIFWRISGDCDQASVPSGHSGLTLDYNLWSSTPDTDAQGPHDPPYATPMLNKTTGWRSMTGGDLNGSDFALRSASPAIDAGIPLGAEFDDIPECDKSVWPAQIVLMDQDNQGSTWEIGADIHVANPTALGAPTGLKITAGQ